MYRRVNADISARLMVGRTNANDADKRYTVKPVKPTTTTDRPLLYQSLYLGSKRSRKQYHYNNIQNP